MFRTSRIKAAYNVYTFVFDVYLLSRTPRERYRMSSFATYVYNAWFFGELTKDQALVAGPECYTRN